MLGFRLGALLLVLLSAGCRERNPGYTDRSAAHDGSAWTDAETTAPDSTPRAVDSPDRVEALDSATDSAAGSAGAERDAAPSPDVSLAGDAQSEGPLTSFDAPIAATCGTEVCNGLDDDCDGMVDEGLGTFTCGLGNCRITVPACVGGVINACRNPQAPVSIDGCGNGDEDCDGAIDENCASSCVPVAPFGDDRTANGTRSAPFATIQSAINWAAADPSRPRTVCVAGGPDCQSVASYVGPVTMANGISVFGHYESTSWSACDLGFPRVSPTTTIETRTETGVLFPSAVTTATQLARVRIERASSSTTAAVTIDGAKNVTITGVFIPPSPDVQISYGVNVMNGGEASVHRSAIFGGNGSDLAIGVRVIGGRVTIRNNCPEIDSAGRCARESQTIEVGIRGRLPGGAAAMTTYGVFLQGATGSVVDQTSLAGVAGRSGAALAITGDAGGVLVRANHITGRGGVDEVRGVSLSDCNNAAPWIVDNNSIQAHGPAGASGEADAIRATGACHPIVDSNVRIGGIGDAMTSTNGVHCLANPAGTPSRCEVVSNKLVQGASQGLAPIAVAIRCDGGSCARVADNVITGGLGGQAYGLWLEGGGTLVEGNLIGGGCGSQTSTGVYAGGAGARLQNNRIFGWYCPGQAPSGQITGLRVRLGATSQEIDVHSNLVDAGGSSSAPTGCAATAVALEEGAMPLGPQGVFRNNIFRGGACGKTLLFHEGSVAADPRILENNDLNPFPPPTALYVDEATRALNGISDVNGLRDITASGNISAAPQFAFYPGDLRLTQGSPCINAGTTAGAPTRDAARKPRDAKPDIGPYEY